MTNPHTTPGRHAARGCSGPPQPIGIAVKETPMLKDFKEFALKGNAVDLAIGVIIEIGRAHV